MELDMYFWGMLMFAFVMSFGIGSNETDALAAVYSSGALTLYKAVNLKKHV